MFLRQPWVTGASTMEGKEGCRQNRKVEAPRFHRSLQRKRRVCLHLSDSVLFKSTYWVQKASWEPLDRSVPWVWAHPRSKCASDLSAAKWIRVSSTFLTEALGKVLSDHDHPRVLHSLITHLSIHPLPSTCALHAFPECSQAWPEHDLGVSTSWRPLIMCFPIGWTLLPTTVGFWANPSTFPYVGFLL